MFFLDFELVNSVHDIIINETGGLKGVKDQGQLESLLFHIQNDEYYPTLVDKVTHLFFGIVQFHCFIDGNKRSAIASSYLFLYLNDIKIPNIALKLEDIAIGVAKGEITKDMLKRIFNSMFISFGYL